MSKPIENRYDIVYFFDITDGNPNGDPDAGNLPRIDPETGQGLVTDVCLKRKVRNYVALTKGDGKPQQGFAIYVQERAILNDQHDLAWKHAQPKAEAKEKKRLPRDVVEARALTRFMCDNFFDIRAFGAVMTTEVNCGQVRGPIQFGIARSVHPIVSQEMALTRCAVTTQKEADKQEGGNRTMGRKFAVPYGLYRVNVFVNANLAAGDKGTGFSEDDLELFKTALDQMFEHDRSAARGNMKPVACVAFRHDSTLGNARADLLFKRVTVTPKTDVQTLPGSVDEHGTNARPPRSSEDYDFAVDEADLPAGVKVEHWIEWT